MTRWTAQPMCDLKTGDCILVIPDEVLEETGWKIDDTLEWIDNGDGSWTLRKKYND